MSVSVIIPAHNVASCLARCLQTAISQSRPPFEIIVIDDGSTDQTAEIAASFASQITFLQQDNQGQGAARNAGLEIASGEFVAFLDADDFWLPEFLQRCTSFLSAHPDAIAVSVGQEIRLWGKQPRISPALLSDERNSRTPFVIDNFFDFWGEHDHVRTGSCLIRRDFIEQAGHQRADLRISQDLEYWGYLATFGKWGFLPEVLWICDPMPAAAHVGWTERYKTRRRMCPTVESWQQRIVPRLKVQDWPGFRQVRGRVAAGYAHAKVLGDDAAGALKIVREFGADMPVNWSSRLMRLAARGGRGGWILACQLLRIRETAKSRMIQRKKLVASG